MAETTCKKKRRSKARLVRDPATGMMVKPPPVRRPHRGCQRRDEKWFLSPAMRAVRLGVNRINSLGHKRRAHAELIPSGRDLPRAAWRARFLKVSR